MLQFLLAVLIIMTGLILSVVVIRTIMVRLFPAYEVMCIGSLHGCDLISLLRIKDEPDRLFEAVRTKCREQTELFCHRIKRMPPESWSPGHDPAEDISRIDELLGNPDGLAIAHALQHIVKHHLVFRVSDPACRLLVRDVVRLHEAFHCLERFRERFKLQDASVA